MGFLKFISLSTNSFEEQNIIVLKGNFNIYFYIIVHTVSMNVLTK